MSEEFNLEQASDELLKYFANKGYKKSQAIDTMKHLIEGLDHLSAN